MKIGDGKLQKTSKKISKINKIIIGSLLLLVAFLSGALFQQREFDIKLAKFAQNIRYTLINELNLVQKNSFQNLYLDIPYKSLDKIYQKREEALDVGVLMTSDEDLVPAKIRLDQGKEMDVDIRLKGDWMDHLDTNKWSYRIHIKNGDMMLGTKRFSIQAPETRNFLAEWAYHQHCLLEGILTTKYTFLNVYENGVYKGIYAFEESFSEELTETQKQREGVILKFDESYFWSNRASFINTGSYWMALENGLFTITDSVESTEVSVFRDTHLSETPTLNQQKEYSISLLTNFLEGKIPASSVFDIEKTGKYYAMADFWAANHSAHWINMRFYYNPVTGLLEPIAFDGIALTDFTNRDYLGLYFNQINIFDDPEIRAAYHFELQRLTKANNFGLFKNSIFDQSQSFEKSLEKEYSSIEPFWDLIEKRRKILFVLANPEHPIRGNYDVYQNEEGTSIKIRLKNLTMFPVEIKQIQIGDEIIQFSEKMLDITQNNNIVMIKGNFFMDFNKTATDLTLPETHLNIPIEFENNTDNSSNIVKVTVKVGEFEREVNLTQFPLMEIYTEQQTIIPNYKIQEVLEQHPFLRADEKENLIVPKGTWYVSGDLIIPEGVNLNLVAGAHLLFETDALLLLRGGSLNIQGTPENFSSLSSIDESWAGILVINSPEESFWQYAEVSNMKGFERKGWMVTGGITYYQSDITITNSLITNSFSEDAINIMHSDYLFNNLSIGNTVSDAFDSDFSNGIIENSYFYQIKGDAVDISGSTLYITSCDFDTIGDKGISAGEQSEVIALYINISNSNIGVASKDLSTVKIDQSEINNPLYIALTAYQKKAMYGPGSIEAKNVIVRSEDKIALVQLGSNVELNGEIFPGQEMDVKTLYDLGILGN